MHDSCRKQIRRGLITFKNYGLDPDLIRYYNIHGAIKVRKKNIRGRGLLSVMPMCLRKKKKNYKNRERCSLT